MAGIRVGTLYSESRDLLEAVAKLGAFHGIPGTTQRQVAQLLQDRGTNTEITPICQIYLIFKECFCCLCGLSQFWIDATVQRGTSLRSLLGGEINSF